MINHLRRVALLFVLLTPLTGVAQEAAPEAPTAEAKAATAKFERTERIEALRYKNLWIAYGAIWFLVFGFVYRTWKRSELTATELDDLKRRLAQLENKDG